MIYRTLAIAFIIIMTGCSHERTAQLDTRLPRSPVVKQMPLHVGVDYSPEFLGFTARKEIIFCGPSGRKDSTRIYYTFPIGAASRDLFDQIIESMFTEITRTAGTLTNTSSVDALLEPQIEFFDLDFVCSQDSLSEETISAKVNYVIHLYNGPDRHLVVSFHVGGQSRERPYLVVRNAGKTLAEQAMRDAMARFMIEFQDNPEVKRWLSTRSAVTGTQQ